MGLVGEGLRLLATARRRGGDQQQTERDDERVQRRLGFSTLETDVEDTASKLSDVCDAMANYTGAFGDIYLTACQ
jgi:hypothetical protein